MINKKLFLLFLLILTPVNLLPFLATPLKYGKRIVIKNNQPFYCSVAYCSYAYLRNQYVRKKSPLSHRVTTCCAAGIIVAKIWYLMTQGDKINQKLKIIQKDLGDLKTSTDAINTTLTKHTNMLNTLVTTVDETKKLTTDILKNIENLEKEFTELKNTNTQEHDQIKSKIDNLNTSFDNKFNEITQKQGDHTELLNTIDTKATNLGEKLTLYHTETKNQFEELKKLILELPKNNDIKNTELLNAVKKCLESLGLNLEEIKSFLQNQKNGNNGRKN